MTESTKNRVQHTPGPWEWSTMNGDRKNPLWVLQSPQRDVVLTIKDAEFGPTTNPSANRRLIAAAPDLLAALKAMLDPDAEGDIDMAIAALHKAEGHQLPPPTSHYFNKPIDQMPCH